MRDRIRAWSSAAFSAVRERHGGDGGGSSVPSLVALLFLFSVFLLLSHLGSLSPPPPASSTVTFRLLGSTLFGREQLFQFHRGPFARSHGLRFSPWDAFPP